MAMYVSVYLYKQAPRFSKSGNYNVLVYIYYMTRTVLCY